MVEYNYGRAKVTIELVEVGNEYLHNKYDIVVSDIRTGDVIGLVSKGLRTHNEITATQGFHFEKAVELAQRYAVLIDTLDMAFHNKLCYSSSYAMDTPKPEYCNEWHKEHNKIKVLEVWIKELKSKYPVK